MAYYQEYTATTANQFVIDLADFVAANGWIVDFNGVYNTSYRRLHFHKGEAHFEVYSTSTLAIYMYGCTGYAAGSAPAAQPNPSALRDIAIEVGGIYRFVSVVDAIYVGVRWSYAATAYMLWSAFFIITNKVGVWSNGFGLQAGQAPIYNVLPVFTRYQSGLLSVQLYYNGMWSSNESAGAGSVYGDIVLTSQLAIAENPSWHNGGIVPFPIGLLLHSLEDASKFRPLGTVPGVYLTHVGDIYNVAEILTIGGDDYLVHPTIDPSKFIGREAYGAYLFRLGA